MRWLEILPKQEGKDVRETYIVYEERAFRFSEQLGIKFPPRVQSIIWIPVYSKAGALVTRIARLLPTPEDGPKFLNAAGSSATPWVLAQILDHKANMPLIICEGPSKRLLSR